MSSKSILTEQRGSCVGIKDKPLNSSGLLLGVGVGGEGVRWIPRAGDAWFVGVQCRPAPW